MIQRIMGYRIHQLLLILVLTFVGLTVHAQDSVSTKIGKVIYLEGSVKLLKDGRFWIPAKIGDEILIENKIKTGLNALVEIDWINGNKSKIAQNSELDALALYENSGKNVKAKTANLWGGFAKVFSEEATAKKQEEGGIRRNMAEVRSKPGRSELYWKETQEVSFDEASTAYTKKDYTKAAQLFDQFISQKPRDAQIPKARFALAHCYVEMNNPVKAKELLTDFIERYPDHELTEVAKKVLESL